MRGDEKRVVAAFCAHLRQHGWSVAPKLHPWDVDVLAERENARIYAEVKGITSDPGTDVDTGYGQLLRRMAAVDEPATRYAIATAQTVTGRPSHDDTSPPPTSQRQVSMLCIHSVEAAGNLERREQVFVSSTYLDLREERQAVIQGLLEADCIPAGMELFPASDSDKWSLIQGVINDSDYYLLIIGGRYGSVDPESDLSYTEMEFDYAVGVGKPIMAFLHGETGSISADKSELNPSMRVKLDAFRAKAEQRMVKYWTTPEELDGAVAKSLIKIRKTHPAEGWVRANYAMTPEVERDIAELRAKVSELTQQLEAERRSSKMMVPEGLAEGEDIYELSAQIAFWKIDDKDEPAFRRKEYRTTIEIPATWNGILSRLGPALLDEATEQTIKSELNNLAIGKLGKNREFLPDGFGGLNRIDIETETLKDIVVQLFALDLIAHGSKRRPVSDRATYWRLTELGCDKMMILRAIRRSDESNLDSRTMESGTSTLYNGAGRL